MESILHLHRWQARQSLPSQRFVQRKSLQALLVNVGYKLQHLAEYLDEDKRLDRTYKKIAAVATAKYGVRVYDTFVNLRDICPRWQVLYYQAQNRIQPLLDQDILYQSIREQFPNTPYLLLAEGSLETFKPRQNLGAYLRLASVLIAPVFIGHCLGNRGGTSLSDPAKANARLSKSLKAYT